MFLTACSYLADITFGVIGLLGAISFFSGNGGRGSLCVSVPLVVSAAVYLGLSRFQNDKLLGFSIGFVILVFLVMFMPAILFDKHETEKKGTEEKQ